MQELDTIVFETPLVRAARFRCTADDPRFRDSGPAGNCAVVFPRTAVWIRYAGSRPFVADPSLATIYNPGQEYTRGLISRDGDRCEWFAVAPEIAIEIAASFDRASGNHEIRPFAATSAPVDRALYLEQRMFFAKLEHGTTSQLEAEETIIALVTSVIGRACASRPSQRSAAGKHATLVERAKASLSRKLSDRQTLTDLASELGVSAYHLCRVFREQTNSTLHAFRTDLRLRRALELLSESASDLSRIALDCGFSSHSHFTAAMRSRFGRTPSAIRTAVRVSS